MLARQAADLIERNRAEQALHEADRKKDDFLATLAHELRNPLAPIRNAVQVLKANGTLHPELKWAQDVIDRQVLVMARLLEDLLDVSRIARNKLELRKEPVELAALVEAALETSRPTIDAARHQVTVTLPPEPVHIEADPVRLAQVFANLLNNAAKYTEENGHIWLSAAQQGTEVMVSVKDSGIGIASEMLPQIFEIFAQASPALERSQGGLGIGLSLVRGLVELHGGAIEAFSDGPGKGSEFIVRLPIIRPLQNCEPVGTEDIRQKQVKSVCILVVDDNRDSADTLAKLLTVMGNEVSTAYDGEQAIDATEKLRPDMVLLDIGMPKLDGYEVCRRIREKPWGQRVFLVALTGWAQVEDRRRTEEAGFNYHFVKPVDPTALSTLFASLPRER